MKAIIVLTSVLLASTLAPGHENYVGYSGAPNGNGACASACHGSSGGTITVNGFPTNYAAGQAYTITVAHDGGSSIENFNASVRVGSGLTNAGTIAAGANTAAYTVGGETNGVHFSSAGKESGTFTWTAPSPAVGTVKLYLAGHQGSSAGGKNTELVLIALGAGIAEGNRGKVRSAEFRLEQSVVTDHLVMRIDNPRAPARVRIIDRNGRVLAKLAVAAGSNQTVAWPLLDSRNRRLSAGTYYAVFDASGARTMAKFTVVAR
ncbi:MAG: hypothetical protein NTX53_10335 [candidate division WOR-3 bacterium]|nr:hypothetical protein [candidate division WOR-3 bacterium]